MVLRTPKGIQKYMSDLTPIFEYSRGLIPIHSNITLPMVPPRPTENISAFVLNGMMVEYTSHDWYETKCTGRHCDFQGMCNDGQVKDWCACYTMRGNSRTIVPLLCIDVKAFQANGEEMIIKNYCSATWTLEFLIRDGIPRCYRAHDLRDYRIDEMVADSLAETLQEVNRSGGWTLIGWSKLGRIQDQAANQDAAYNAPQVMVQSGTATHHLTRLVPTNPGSLNIPRMDGFKVDLTALNPNAQA